MSAGKGSSFPLLKSVEDTVALCQKEHDNFYLTAFVIQGWLGGLIEKAVAEYAEKKHAKDRFMQTDQAWRAFLELFGNASDQEFPHVLSSLFRFTEFQDDPLAGILWKAFVPLSIQHDCSGDYIGPKIRSLPAKEGLAPARRTV